MKKTLVNHVYIRIWSSWLTFTVLQWMKTNFKISQFSRFLLTRVLHGLVPLINMQKLHFLIFCENYRTYVAEILYDNRTDNFTSGVHNCAVKYANFSYAHAQTFVLLNGEMATVSTGFRKLTFWLWLLWTVFYLNQTGFWKIH